MSFEYQLQKKQNMHAYGFLLKEETCALNWNLPTIIVHHSNVVEMKTYIMGRIIKSIRTYNTCSNMCKSNMYVDSLSLILGLFISERNILHEIDYMCVRLGSWFKKNLCITLLEYQNMQKYQICRSNMYMASHARGRYASIDTCQQ